MEILQRDRILTKLFPSDLAIIINLYMIDYFGYIAPKNINHCNANIDYYTKYRSDVFCKLHMDDLKKRLSKFDKYPELQNLTKHINVVDCKFAEMEECMMSYIEIKTCNLLFTRCEYGLSYDTRVKCYYRCGDEDDNFNNIDDVIDIIYSALHFKYVPTYIFRDYMECIFKDANFYTWTCNEI